MSLYRNGKVASTVTFFDSMMLKLFKLGKISLFPFVEVTSCSVEIH